MIDEKKENENVPVLNDVKSVIMPGISEELTPVLVEEPKIEQTVTIKKKGISKKFMIIFGVLGIFVIASIIFVISSTTNTITTPVEESDAINDVENIKEKALNDMREKNATIKLTITDVGSYLDNVESLSYSIIEINTNVIKNYDVTLTSSDYLELLFMRYYNMDYNYTDINSTNKYNKIYAVIINKSNINSYNYQINYNVKNTYSAENYNNYGVKISYSATSGNTTKLSQVNAIYDEIHQRKYIRVSMSTNDFGNTTKIVYEDLQNGLSYIKLPTSVTWTKSTCKKTTLNLKALEEYLVNGGKGVKKLSQSVYKLNISRNQIEPLLFDIEALPSAPATISFKNNRISKIVYEFKDNIDGYSNLVMTIDITDVNNAGEVVIPSEATK